ncbi:ArsR/SmtB family transcription factor [Thalassospira lucentensis]|uniref:ArsR/SmtB family transcription factor n=1 Tax=Thalassospira lucentensis TaxID=168935 RepID=UPI0003B4EA8F|nr:metalloregulator ArsR/SmtB family transcription factor [Thalassospira lucentensis]RCK19453.1 ArsR family transcriptional regulator [Thalassospira lucentensis MCCC 1A00383 = DSM 14000]
MEQVLARLRAAAEATRLRLLAICAECELTVSEITQIIGQSQPRVSRHLKLLCEAGLLVRFREGTWVFYRTPHNSAGADLVRPILDLLPVDDETLSLDRARLDQVKVQREQIATEYFRANAKDWDRIRSLHVDEAVVEKALLDAVGDLAGGRILDVGTGTGRILELLGRSAEEGVGVDMSREMLAVARARLQRADLSNCLVRQADMYQLPYPGGMFDIVILHQVLHFAEKPEAAIDEASRVLAPGGRLVVVDFASHDREELREEHAHRRLGFDDAAISTWFRACELAPDDVISLPGKPLTVRIWSARADMETAKQKTHKAAE